MPDTLDIIERRAIEDAVERHRGDIRAAAAELGIGRATLYRRRQQWESSDRTRLPRIARARGVSQDEVATVLGDITQAELGHRINRPHPAAHHAAHEAARLLGVRITRHGVMLAVDRTPVAEELERIAQGIRQERPTDTAGKEPWPQRTFGDPMEQTA